MTTAFMTDERIPLLVLTAFTLVFAWQDRRERSISLGLLMVFGSIGAGLSLLGHRTVISCLPALLPGMVLLLLSKAARGGIGLGDALYVFVCGLYLELSRVLLLLSASLLGAGIAALWILARRWRFAANQKEGAALPFLVFMLPGIVLLWGVRGGAG